MALAPNHLLDLCTLNDGSKFHAGIVCSNGTLLCFTLNKNNAYEEMTEQGSTDDQALNFPATEQRFVEKCLPGIIRGTFGSGIKNIAFVDTETRWDHKQLLNGWEESQAEKTRQSNIFVQAFRMDHNNHPVRTAEAKLLKAKTEHSSARERAPERPVPPATLPYSPQYQFQLDEIKDIPAEFMSFVWKSRRVSTGGNAPTEAWDCLRQAERSLTTREVAERVRSKPFASEALSINEVLSVYRDLCAGVNRYLVVPMIGFDQGWLSATSHLAGYSDLSTYHLGTEDLASLRRRKYKTLALGRQNGQGRLTTTVQRCLKSAYTGLRLLDLTEDVICSLTGKTRVVLSLADVCRIHSLVEERHVPG